MTTVYLSGGFGNQLFMLCAGALFAKRTGQPLHISYKLFNAGNSSVRQRLHSWFDVDIPGVRSVVHAEEVAWPPRIARGSWSLAMRSPGMWPFTPWVSDKSLDTAFRLRNARKRRLVGYFQRADIPELLRSEGSLPYLRALRGGAAVSLGQEKIRNRDAVIVHFRRGDYLTLESGLRSLPLAYYLKAIEHVRTMDASGPLVAFGDIDEDFLTALSNLADEPIEFASDFYGGYDASIDFQLMQAARYAIGSNSTFSWWSSFTSIHRVLTITPQPWQTGVGPSDLTVRGWISIPSELPEDART